MSKKQELAWGLYYVAVWNLSVAAFLNNPLQYRARRGAEALGEKTLSSSRLTIIRPCVLALESRSEGRPNPIGTFSEPGFFLCYKASEALEGLPLVAHRSSQGDQAPVDVGKIPCVLKTPPSHSVG